MKKGFTLVELLAVIVILAIIALIVTPVVGNIITSARTSANARSVEGHIRNVELAIMQEGFTKETGDLTAYDMTNGNIPTSLVDRLPNNDIVFCTKYTIENGTVLSATDCASNVNNWNKKYNYTNSEGAKVTGANNILVTLVAPGANDTHKGIIYMDPTNLSATCTSTSTIDASQATGCKKFYIYDDTGNTYKLIMDRNMGANIQWISKADYVAAGGTEAEYGTAGNTSKGPITALNALKNRTTNWIGNPRMITADEVAHIVGADLSTTIKWDSSKTYKTGTTISNINADVSWIYLDGGSNSSKTSYSQSNGWQKQYAASQGASKYAWLYDYTNGCTSSGCNTALSSTDGYWTTSITNDGTQSYTYNVIRVGILSRYTSAITTKQSVSTNYFGVRPVLEIPKALINS